MTQPTTQERAALEPFRAEGLRAAMYVIPALGALLTLVLFAASRTVAKDAERLQNWMRESSASAASAEAPPGSAAAYDGRNTSSG